MATKSICSIPDCCKRQETRGWCCAHYYRWRIHGDPLAGRTLNGEAQRYFREVVLAYEGDECLIWPYAKSGNGYGKMRCDGRDKLVSRLVCEDANGPPPTPKHEAAHSCGHGHLACVTKRHLSWKTSAGNKADMIGHGTQSRGARNGSAKLTECDVGEIRALRGLMSQRAIAKQFGINQSNVSSIHRRTSWGWLE